MSRDFLKFPKVSDAEFTIIARTAAKAAAIKIM